MKYLVLFFCLLLVGCDEIKVDEFKVYEQSGFFAFVVNSYDFGKTDNSTPNVADCPCNGTKIVKSGDGILNIACPCGSNCQCGKNQGSMPQAEVEKVEKVKRLYYFGDHKNCPPCREMERDVFPELKKKNWTFGHKPTDLIHVYDYNDNKEIQEFANRNITSFPTILLLEDGVEVLRFEQKMSAVEVTDMYYKKIVPQR